MERRDLADRHPLLTSDDLDLIEGMSPRHQRKCAIHIEKIRASLRLTEHIMLEMATWHKRNMRLVFAPTTPMDDARRLWFYMKKMYAYLTFREIPVYVSVDPALYQATLCMMLDQILQHADGEDIETLYPWITGDIHDTD